MIKYLPFELHCHSLHSDGMFTPQQLVQQAKESKLSGIAITDHNTATAYGSLVETAGDLIIIEGVELTTFYGHITVLGTSDIDWRKVNRDTIASYAERIKQMGACIGIAHPYRIGYPICSGCNDDWGVSDYNIFTHYEVWSALSPATDDTNKLAEQNYYKLCEKGNKLACVYGRDWHRTEAGNYAMTFLGIDGELSASSAISAIKARRTYISTNIVMDAKLVAEKAYEIGETVKAGQYDLQIECGLFDAEYTAKYRVKIQKIVLDGTAISDKIVMDISQKGRKLNLKAGFLQISVMGELNDNYQKLLISTPFFVE